MLFDEEPVAAVITPPGIAGVSIVRVSGVNTYSICRNFFSSSRAAPETVKKAFFHCVLKNPADGKNIDESMVLVFPKPHSYTGEEVVEFQVHGGRMSVSRIMSALAELGVRTALPGEFTRRAFINGRIDLSQAEAVMDIVSAQTGRAADRALEQLGGSVSRRVDSLYDEIVNICADMEATLDFDEDEVPSSLSPDVLLKRIEKTDVAITEMISTWNEGRLLREGALAVISGRPNSGKSSLFNALLGYDRAIVSEEPGTTRDTIEESFVADGVQLRLVDTAGLRESNSGIEKNGIIRAFGKIKRADINIRVIDITSITDEDITSAASLSSDESVIVLNKEDAYSEDTIPEKHFTEKKVVRISAKTGKNLSALISAIAEKLGTADFGNEDVAVSSRHRELLESASVFLKEAITTCSENFEAVITAQALNAAADKLGEITGKTAGEDVLDRIFSRFCVGK